MDPEISLDMFVQSLQKQVQRFKSYWEQEAEKNPEQFSPKMLPGEWNEQFEAFFGGTPGDFELENEP